MSVVDPKLLALLVCPVTKMPLVYDVLCQELISPSAGLAYPIKNGVPLMVEDMARPLGGMDGSSDSSSFDDSCSSGDQDGGGCGGD
jgi:uncharacterized protein